MQNFTLKKRCPQWALAVLHKCCYKWWPRKGLGVDVANLIILISKKGEKIPKNQKFFIFWKNIHQKKNTYGNPLIGWVLPMTVTTYTIYAVPSFLMILFEPAHYTIL
jgi:hypothetical protein